jgi:glycine/serine hydroxymethyltransferase
MKEEEMHQIGTWIADALEHHTDDDYLKKIKGQVKELCLNYPVPGIRV